MRRRKGMQRRGLGLQRHHAHAWYAGPTCKACYDREKTAQRQQKKRVHNEEAEDESGGDNVLEVIKISGSRCASARTPRPSFTNLSLQRAACADSLPSRRTTLWKDRSNPPPDDSSDSDNDDCELEYDVYGWFNFDDDKEGVRRLDRQWVLLGAAAAAIGWEDAVQAYEEKIKKKKQELE